MNSPFAYRLNAHFIEKVQSHPVVVEKDYRQSSIQSFIEVLNSIKATEDKDKETAEDWQKNFRYNGAETIRYLRKMDRLGLTLLIGGRAIAMALNIEDRVYISSKDNFHNAKINTVIKSGKKTKEKRGGEKKERRSSSVSSISSLIKDPSLDQIIGTQYERTHKLSWGDIVDSESEKEKEAKI